MRPDMNMEQYRGKIEEYGNRYEQQGFPPVAARILIYLLLCAEGEATFEELVEYFGVSKSAVSNALKLLKLMEIITERTKSGARRRYFSAKISHLFSPEKIAKHYHDLRVMLEDIYQARDHQDRFSQEMEEIVSIIKVLEVEYPALYKRIKKKVGDEKNSPGIKK